MRIRKTDSGTPVTWTFARSTTDERNLCLWCTAKDGNLCPRHRLTARQKEEQVAVRCIFINIKPG